MIEIWHKQFSPRWGTDLRRKTHREDSRFELVGLHRPFGQGFEVVDIECAMAIFQRSIGRASLQ
jgi:hypothetical protein